MPRTRKPRAGSLQFWPRVRSRYSYPRIRNWKKYNQAKPLGFAGYKVGMTHVMIYDTRQYSLTKGSDIFCPVTIVECPPLIASSIRYYKKRINGSNTLVSEIISTSITKELGRKIIIPKKGGKGVEDFDFVRLLCHTQPKFTCLGKKKPEIFEMAIGGNRDEQYNYTKEKLGKEINVNEVFKEGQLLDAHSITRGKGFQGPIRRFGIQLRHHKSEKSRRNPGSLGPWKSQGHVMWRVAHAGKMGYHLRTEYDKWLVKIGNKPDEINTQGGFVHYGVVKNPYILIKGSIGGTQKRLIRLTEAMRPKSVIVNDAPQITYVSTESKQGN